LESDSTKLKNEKTNMTSWKTIILNIMISSCLTATVAFSESQKSQKPGITATSYSGTLAGHRYRVLATTDIWGTDPNDFQSMMHLLVYVDVLYIEGIISSPFGKPSMLSAR
jgi:hypothetical protein